MVRQQCSTPNVLSHRNLLLGEVKLEKFAVSFPMWAIVFLVFGCIVGSFLRLCIHRLPLGLPFDIPLLSWIPLPGKRRECATPIPGEYSVVEVVTGAAFLTCWVAFGHQSVALALVYCLFLAGLIVATATDFEHLIIPDEITVGGMIAGLICSILLPRLHDESTWLRSLGDSLLGLALGGGGIYAVLRGGKMVFGRQRIRLRGETRILFSETAVHMPDQEVPFDELFYRKSDTIALEAKTVELADRCYHGVRVCLSPEKLEIGNDAYNPEAVPYMEVVTAEIVFPREAMGLGDAKLMAAIGAFLGWAAVLFTVVVGALAGSVYGLAMIALKRQTWSGRLYFGPFLSLGATLWIFEGPALVERYQHLMQQFMAP
jgi:leader peptidase (prepilin peptidase) / N-methyltransferase